MLEKVWLSAGDVVEFDGGQYPCMCQLLKASTSSGMIPQQRTGDSEAAAQVSTADTTEP